MVTGGETDSVPEQTAEGTLKWNAPSWKICQPLWEWWCYLQMGATLWWSPVNVPPGSMGHRQGVQETRRRMLRDLMCTHLAGGHILPYLLLHGCHQKHCLIRKMVSGNAETHGQPVWRTPSQNLQVNVNLPYFPFYSPSNGHSVTALILDGSIWTILAETTKSQEGNCGHMELWQPLPCGT